MKNKKYTKEYYIEHLRLKMQSVLKLFTQYFNTYKITSNFYKKIKDFFKFLDKTNKMIKLEKNIELIQNINKIVFTIIENIDHEKIYNYAIKWLKFGHLLNINDSSYNLAIVYIFSDAETSNRNEGIRIMKELTERKLRHPCLLLGKFYETGLLVGEISIEKSIKYYEKAASLGCEKSYGGLASLYYNIDVEKSFNYAKIAANMGDLTGLHLLSIFYICGIHVKQSTDRALEIMKETITIHEDKSTLYNIGRLYESLSEKDPSNYLNSLYYYDLCANMFTSFKIENELNIDDFDEYLKNYLIKNKKQHANKYIKCVDYEELKKNNNVYNFKNVDKFISHLNESDNNYNMDIVDDDDDDDLIIEDNNNDEVNENKNNAMVKNMEKLLKISVENETVARALMEIKKRKKNGSNIKNNIYTVNTGFNSKNSNPNKRENVSIISLFKMAKFYESGNEYIEIDKKKSNYMFFICIVMNYRNAIYYICKRYFDRIKMELVNVTKKLIHYQNHENISHFKSEIRIDILTAYLTLLGYNAHIGHVESFDLLKDLAENSELCSKFIKMKNFNLMDVCTEEEKND
jgi:TPR repeat protein